ncbi:site-specific integrase [Emcibacter nanhaiensis]|nr:site-specific integrase [Emcibacter nanhaiensis]
MAKYPGLSKRGSRYQIRRKVPVDLIDVYAPKKEITYSLKTSDWTEALKRLNVENVKIDAEFDKKRMELEAANKPARSELTETEIRTIGRLYFAWLLSEDDEQRLKGITDEYLTGIEVMEDTAKQAYALGGKNALFDDLVDEVLAWEGVNVRLEADSPSRLMLSRELQAQTISAVKKIDLRDSGQVVETPKPTALARALEEPVPAAKKVTIKDLFHKWKAAAKPQDKTAYEFEKSIDRFVRYNGDLDYKRITKSHIRDYKDMLLQYPSILTKQQREMDISELIESLDGKEDIKRLSPSTVNEKHLAALNTILNWAVSDGYLDANPALGIKAIPSKEDTGRLPYDIDDLQLIFSLPAITGEKTPRAAGGAAAKWLPLLCLYTGAREEEIAQALLNDVKEEDGITYIDLVADETTDKRLKTKSSRRRLPVPKTLLDLGFMKYVHNLREDKETRLFPELTKDQFGNFSGSWSKWYSRYVRSKGLNDRRKVFHSFRHTFKDACRQAGIDEAVHDALTGHAGATVGRRYGSGSMAYSVKQLKEAIDKVSYPGLDLSHLKNT